MTQAVRSQAGPHAHANTAAHVVGAAVTGFACSERQASFASTKPP